MKGQAIDHAVGYYAVKVGDRVGKGQPILTIHARTEQESLVAESRLMKALHFSDEPVAALPLFYDRIGAADVALTLSSGPLVL